MNLIEWRWLEVSVRSRSKLWSANAGFCRYWRLMSQSRSRSMAWSLGQAVAPETVGLARVSDGWSLPMGVVQKALALFDEVLLDARREYKTHVPLL